MICDICPRACVLDEGAAGFCGVRANINGINTPLNYGRITPPALDPIEKKPLARYKSGSRVLSTGSFGCNFSCPFCQNHHISMLRPRQAGDAVSTAETAGMIPVTSGELVAQAASLVARGNIGLAYTYNEPLTGYEFVRDTARLAKERGLDNVLVTNGCLNRRYFEEVLPFIDAMNIDLKAFRASFYDRITDAVGQPVQWTATPRTSGIPLQNDSVKNRFLETVKKNIELAAHTCHLEITCLIIPGENDSDDEMDAISSFIAALSPDIPLHITRFFPRYLYTGQEPTPIETIRHLARIARKQLHAVFTGNM
jgi:pyruvate formate lyase activating enzyme